MSFVVNGATRTITEQAQAGNPPLVEYSLLSDLYVDVADWHLQNLNYRFPLRQIGGDLRYLDNLGNPVFSTIDIFLQNQADEDWRLVPANYPHTIVLSGANLLEEDSSLPLWDFSGLTSQVIVIPRFSDLQVGYQISGSSGGGGLTVQQDQKLTTAANVSGRLNALIENVDGDRFTAKALEQVQDDGFTAADQERLLKLTKAIGLEPGISASQVSPTLEAPGSLQTSDDSIRQTLVIDPSGKITISLD